MSADDGLQRVTRVRRHYPGARVDGRDKDGRRARGQCAVGAVARELPEAADELRRIGHAESPMRNIRRRHRTAELHDVELGAAVHGRVRSRSVHVTMAYDDQRPRGLVLARARERQGEPPRDAVDSAGDAANAVSVGSSAVAPDDVAGSVPHLNGATDLSRRLGGVNRHRRANQRESRSHERHRQSHRSSPRRTLAPLLLRAALISLHDDRARIAQRCYAAVCCWRSLLMADAPEGPDDDIPGPSADETVDLVNRVRAGDQEALAVLMSRFLPRLRRWASGRMPNRLARSRRYVRLCAGCAAPVVSEGGAARRRP